MLASPVCQLNVQQRVTFLRRARCEGTLTRKLTVSTLVSITLLSCPSPIQPHMHPSVRASIRPQLDDWSIPCLTVPMHTGMWSALKHPTPTLRNLEQYVCGR